MGAGARAILRPEEQDARRTAGRRPDISGITISNVQSLDVSIEAVYITNEADDPRVIEMLETLIAGQNAEVVRDAAEKARNMTFVEDVRTAFGQLNTRTTEIKNDQADLIRRLAENPSDAEKAEILASFNALNNELGEIASGYEPVPVTPGEVPGTTPVPEPEPGTGDGGVPTDGGTGDGGTGDGGAGGTGDGGTPNP